MFRFLANKKAKTTWILYLGVLYCPCILPPLSLFPLLLLFFLSFSRSFSYLFRFCYLPLFFSCFVFEFHSFFEMVFKYCQLKHRPHVGVQMFRLISWLAQLCVQKRTGPFWCSAGHPFRMTWCFTSSKECKVSDKLCYTFFFHRLHPLPFPDL